MTRLEVSEVTQPSLRGEETQAPPPHPPLKVVAQDGWELADAAFALLTRKDELLALTAHDLGQPLTVIRAQADLFRRRLQQAGTLDPEYLAAGLTIIDGAGGRLAAMLAELLDVAHLKTGQQLDLQRSPTDLVALTRAVVAHYQVTTELHQFHCTADLPGLVGFLDAERIQRVLANLLSNAIKYAPKGGTILVSVARRETSAGAGASGELVVRDEGIGISAADLPRIFEPFQRGANVKQFVAGFGLAGC